MARHQKVQVSIDHLVVTREGTTVEARDVIVSATGTNAFEAAEAVRTQLVEVFTAAAAGRADDEPED